MTDKRRYSRCAIRTILNRLALSGHAIAVPALLIGGYPQVRDKFSPHELAMQMAKTESE